MTQLKEWSENKTATLGVVVRQTVESPLPSPVLPYQLHYIWEYLPPPPPHAKYSQLSL